MEWMLPPGSPSFSRYHSFRLCVILHLVEWVGSSAPVREEQAEANGFEDASQDTDGDGVERALFNDDLGDELQKREKYQHITSDSE